MNDYDQRRLDQAHQPHDDPSTKYKWTPRDSLDTTAELDARVEALWKAWLETEDSIDGVEYPAAIRVALAKGAIRTALIRAQRDAAHRALNNAREALAEALDREAKKRGSLI